MFMNIWSRLVDILRTITSLLTSKKHLNLEEKILEIETAELQELVAIREEVKELLRSKDSYYIHATVNGFKITSQGNLKMAFDLKDTPQFTVLTATILDAAGKPASLSSVPVWTSSDESIVTVVAAADGKSATVTSAALGFATVNFSVDGITATFEVSVVGGPAASVTITASPAADVVLVAPEAPVEAEPTAQ
jgi:hypothetical protein